MIITRSPFRISLGGGGTDLPDYYKKHGGSLITAAIDKFMYISVNRLKVEKFIRLKYSKTEKVNRINDIKHDLAREALRLTDSSLGLEIASIADLPARTGLGSSGSYTVALLKALHSLKKEVISAKELAEEACHIEMDILDKPVGKQDQYIASFGGIIRLDINQKGKVKVKRLNLPLGTIKKLENDLILCYTSIRRESYGILKEKVKKTSMLHKIKKIGEKSEKALLTGNTKLLGRLLDLHWQTKKTLSDKISNSQIDYWYEKAKKSGAVGGKIMGAGGGGFFMFCCPGEKRFLRETLKKEGLIEIDWRFDFEGTKIISDFN